MVFSGGTPFHNGKEGTKKKRCGKGDVHFCPFSFPGSSGQSAGPAPGKKCRGQEDSVNPNMIDTSRPEDIPVLADLLADLFSMETDFRVDRDLQSRGLRMIIESPERGTILVGRTSAGTINGMVTVGFWFRPRRGGHFRTDRGPGGPKRRPQPGSGIPTSGGGPLVGTGPGSRSLPARGRHPEQSRPVLLSSPWI